VLYTLAPDPNPADGYWPDISQFRVRRLYPRPLPASGWHIFTPQEWAEHLVSLRVWQARKVDAEYDRSVAIG
jgi:hypothetical protein